MAGSMAGSMAAQHINLARTLPTRLQRFFALNPPHFDQITNAASTPATHIPSASSLSSSTETSATKSSIIPPESNASVLARLNPFQPHKNPKTGRWHPPIYSLRAQADLCKLARQYGVEELLPYSKKKMSEKARVKEEFGLRVKGTGVGQQVKGHKWERTLKGRQDKKRQAMVEMPALVHKWKLLRRGRFWKQYPK